MRIDVLTIFPEMFAPVLGSSILKRAIAKGVAQVSVHDLRDWSRDKHKKVDDRPYGGGPGMVMRPEPFFEAVAGIKRRIANRRLRIKPHVILLAPQGEKLTQGKAEELSKRPWLILLCGHYEGVDERVRSHLADEELSIGDYVLTGGELPAMVLIDSVARLLPGSLGDAASASEESFSGPLLEYPQYTRPPEYRGMKVPEVLRSGNAPKINEWRKLQALRWTLAQRPDLIDGSSD
ncbi:MAG: tRNA (guanosine(37)-N1)-methyltransferase TrmD [Candidatus Omnitrophica bacterium]|nr:tRNA (guanosine(37)-N1)-methyltransferase TrmD [Candidatus Omnitrophota bacterium]